MKKAAGDVGRSGTFRAITSHSDSEDKVELPIEGLEQLGNATGFALSLWRQWWLGLRWAGGGAEQEDRWMSLEPRR